MIGCASTNHLSCTVLLSRTELRQESLRECFLNVADISEEHSLDILQTIMKYHHTLRQPPTSDSMAVDAVERKEATASDANVPPLRTFLAYVVNYPGSLQAWRLAIHRRFSQTEDLLELLGIIEEWMKVYESKDLQLSLGEIKTNDQCVPVPKFDHSKKLERVKGMLLPPLDKVGHCSQDQITALTSPIDPPISTSSIRRVILESHSGAISS